MPSQILAAGLSGAQKYEGLGFTDAIMSYPLAKCFGILVGKFHSGKSAILQSCPTAFIFNLDQSSTVVNPCPATIWPGVDKQGRIVDVDGTPIQITWERIAAKLGQLEQLAIAGKPRPEIVAFDSLTSLIPYIKDHILRENNANAKANSKPVKPNFKDWGEGAWESLHDRVVTMMAKLRSWDYGPWLTVHLREEYLQLGGDSTTYVQNPRLSISDGFFGKLALVAELVAPVVYAEVTTEKSIPQPPTKLTDGREFPNPPKIEFVKTPQHYLDFQNPKLSGITKGRGMKGTITLPSADAAWATFEAAYLASR